MHLAKESSILVENKILPSSYLQREVSFEFFIPNGRETVFPTGLLLVNDGQNLEEIGFRSILQHLHDQKMISPLICVGIKAGQERKMEYGVSAQPDYKGRGAHAAAYTSFIIQELMPYIAEHFPRITGPAGFAGFSLGGLSALDIAWNHPQLFSKVGVFSGSLWWRSMDQHDNDYNDDQHRIMHQQIRKGKFHPGQKFFFQCGNMDETRDRNNNGVIDSIDDTLDLVNELSQKGYDPNTDIRYLELADGRHDMATWARAMPEFLKWAWPFGSPHI
jgi:enterochelin esterase-like enzyme